MHKRRSSSVWTGGKAGKGHLTSTSGVLKETSYNFQSRFGEEAHTNPEELVAAAHAGCFNMKLAIVLENAGHAPDQLNTECTITIDGGVVTSSHLELSASIQGISTEKFVECVRDAEKNCPISKLLNTSIIVDAKLNFEAVTL